MARTPSTNFIEGPDDYFNSETTFSQTPLDPSAGERDQPGSQGGNATIFTTNPPDKGAPVGPDETRIVHATVETRRYEEEQRLPTRHGVDRIWELYHGRYDFSMKEDWQSQKVSPKVYTTVERIVSTVIRIKERSRNWFDLEALSEQSQIFYNTVQSLVRFFLDHDEVNFDKHLRVGLKSGLLSHMMYFLVTWENNGHIETESAQLENVEMDFGNAFAPMFGGGASSSPNEKPIMPGKNQSKLRVEVLNPDYVYLDSTGRNRFKIWEVRYSKGEALREAEERGWDIEKLKKAISSPATVHDTANTISGFHESRDARKQDKLPEYRPHSKVKITNYFGDLYDQTSGEILVENSYFIVANDNQLVYGPVENPFWDGQDPIIAAPFTEVPFAAYGRSPLIQNIDMFESWVEYYNLVIDFLQSVLLGIKEIDMDQVEDWDENVTDLYPGKVLKTSKGGQNVQAVMTSNISEIPSNALNVFQLIQQELTDNVMLSNMIGGQPRPRGRMTALEDNRRAADAGAMMEFIFSALEDNLLAPVIRTCFYRILQFMPQSMWEDWITTHEEEIRPKDPNFATKWASMFEQMKKWGPDERWNNLAGLFKFKVRIFSALGDKQMEIEKATFFMQTVSQIPGVANLINWDKLLRHLAVSFNWNPEEILNPEAVPAPAQQTPTGETRQIDGSQLQASGGEGTIDKGPSIGAPTSISTNAPFIPGNKDGTPGG